MQCADILWSNSAGFLSLQQNAKIANRTNFALTFVKTIAKVRHVWRRGDSTEKKFWASLS
jgi:hypothetical protein